MLHALVRKDEDYEVVAVAPLGALEAVEREEAEALEAAREEAELHRAPVRDVRLLRPVVAVREGVVEWTSPGFGEPVVVDLDAVPAALFSVGVDDAEILSTVESLEEAVGLAWKALLEGAWKVDLELRDEEGETLEVLLLYEAYRDTLELPEAVGEGTPA